MKEEFLNEINMGTDRFFIKKELDEITENFLNRLDAIEYLLKNIGEKYENKRKLF